MLRLLCCRLFRKKNRVDHLHDTVGRIHIRDSQISYVALFVTKGDVVFSVHQGSQDPAARGLENGVPVARANLLAQGRSAEASGTT